MTGSGGTEPGSAMTEVALALAMAFFALMLLTMLSMGAGAPSTLPEGLAVRDSVPGGKKAAVVEPHRLVIYHGGELLDSKLKPFDVDRLTAVGPAVGPIVLAVPPGLSFTQVLEQRRRLSGAELSVTMLDERWLRRLGGGRR